MQGFFHMHLDATESEQPMQKGICMEDNRKMLNSFETLKSLQSLYAFLFLL